MFPDIADNQDAIDVGVALRKLWGGGALLIILFSCQTSSKSIAQRLFASWVPLMDCCPLHETLEANVPLFIIVFLHSCVFCHCLWQRGVFENDFFADRADVKQKARLTLKNLRTGLNTDGFGYLEKKRKTKPNKFGNELNYQYYCQRLRLTFWR